MNISDANSPEWDKPVMFVSVAPSSDLGEKMSAHHPIGRIAAEFKAQWGIPEVVTAPVFLGVATAATCGRYFVVKDEFATFPVALYVASFSDPGTLKSPLLSAAARPLREAQQATAAVLDPDILARAMKTEAIQAALAKVGRDMAAKLAKGQPTAAEEAQAEGLRLDLERLRGAGFTEAFRPVTLGADLTPEAAVKRAVGQAGRIALLSAEAGLLENIAGRYSDGDPRAEFFNAAFDGDPHDGARVSDPGGRAIEKPWASILQVVQPDVAKTLLGSPALARRGFLARWWLFIAGPSEYVCRGSIPPIDGEALAPFEEAVARIWQSGPDWLTEYHLDVPGPARDVFLTFEHDVIAPAMRRAQGDGQSPMMNWLGKVAMTTWRVAAVLGLVSDPDARVITVQAAEQAVEFAGLALKHTDHLLVNGPDSSVRSPRYQVLRALVRGSVGSVGSVPGSADEIEVDNGRFTKRSVHVRFKGSKWCQSADDVEAVLQDLAHLGWVRFEQKTTTDLGGRPSEVWQVHPQLVDHWQAMTGGAS